MPTATAMPIALRVAVLAIATGNGLAILLLYFLPVRIAVFVLGWAFDYLPHNELTATPEQDRYRTTRNRVGLERLLSPLLLYQNYHLVHHLHPLVRVGAQEVRRQSGGVAARAAAGPPVKWWRDISRPTCGSHARGLPVPCWPRRPSYQHY